MMKRLKNHNPLRDALMGLFLLVLVRSALHLEADRQRNQLNEQPFMVHEPAQEVIDTFATAKLQLEQAITLALQKNKPEVIEKLEDMTNAVETMQSRYTNHSPALLFLGPFASVSIVLKEREIEQQLAQVLNDLNGVLHGLLGQQEKDTYSPEQMQTCLNKNRKLLAQFAVSQPEQATA